MESILIEIRAAEGGDDSKLLVADQLSAYVKAADRGHL
jgi:protein subunit release factor A